MPHLDRKKIQQPDFERPHVVILGAGTSLAACPNGDKLGRKLPLMRNIIDLVGLSPLLDREGIRGDRNDFEVLYSDLVITGRYPGLVAEIDNAVFEYFAEMELPDEPTLYDHLVLSLRNKDVIATFNWDPFLLQAMARNGNSKSFPRSLFLHGNVAIGYCMEHKPIGVGRRGQTCHRCGRVFHDSRLLYPVRQKNYQQDPFISKSWELLQDSLKDAYLVTVFGYSAPSSDVEAVELLKSAWEIPQERNLEEIEIIDVKDEEELYRTWKPFIHSHHYQTTKSFYESIIGRSPRRSCEAMWMCLMDVVFIDTNPIPQSADWTQMNSFFDELLEDERQHQISRSRAKGDVHP